MGILISWDYLPGAAPVYDKDSKIPQPVFDWNKRRWVHQRKVRRTYAPSITLDTWKQLAAAIADGYLELLEKYSEGEMLVSYCPHWILVGKNLNAKQIGYRAALTFFPKGCQLPLKEIRQIPEEGLGNVPDWFAPVKNLNKGTAAILAAMES
jgi:hypothetical protein